MGSYEITTEGGTYQVDTADAPESQPADISDLPENAVKNLGRILNPMEIAKGVGQQVKTGAYDLPKEATESLAQTVGDVVTGEDSGQTPFGKRLQETAESEPVRDTKNWAIRNPLDAAALAAAPVTAFLPETAGATQDLADRSARLAQEQSVKSLEGAMGQVRQIGPERARELGQAALDKKVVSPFTPTTLGMERKLAKLGQEAGEAVGAGRAAGDAAGGAPDIDLLKNNAEATLTPDYETGMKAGQTGALKNAIDEIAKIKGPAGQEPGFSDIAGKATEMNKFAAKNKMLQPEGPTTDVANFLSRENNAALQKALTPEQWNAYQKALSDYGTFEDIKKFFVRGEERQMAGRGSGFTTDLYKGIKDVLGHKTLAWGADKFAKFLQNPAVAKAMPALSAAAKQGPAALATTHYLLKEHNKGYADAAQ